MCEKGNALGREFVSWLFFVCLSEAFVVIHSLTVSYFCEQCEDRKKAVRQERIQKLPPYLFVRLVRYKYNPKTQEKKKLRNPIRYSEVMNMKEVLGDGLADEVRVFVEESAARQVSDCVGGRI